MLLGFNELVLLQKNGVITNVGEGSINSASIDLTLGRFIKAEYRKKSLISLNKREPLSTITIDLEKTVYFDLEPGNFILAQTEQMFNLPNNISAEYKLKSSMARIGLEHLNAGWCDAGWNNSVLTLELKNMTSYHTIRIHAGDPIGQIVFFSHSEVPVDKSYATRGRYNNDKMVNGIKP